MKKFAFLAQATIVLLAIVALAGCSQPVNHFDEACSAYKQVRSNWIAENSDDDVLRASMAHLAGVVAVWFSDKGGEDPRFYKFSDYSKKLNAVFLEGSAQSAKDYFAFEDSTLQGIERLCKLPSTYVEPLNITTVGCWSGNDVTAHLEQRIDGKWVELTKKTKLTKTSLCGEKGYPWGADFVERRFNKDVLTYRIVWVSNDGTFGNGKKKSISCPVTANAYQKQISIGSWDGC